MYVPVNVDESCTRFDLDRCALLIKIDDFVHATHVEQSVAVIECQITVAATSATRTDAHSIALAINECFAALFEGRWTSDQRMRTNRSDQRFDVFPLHEVKGLLCFNSSHRRTNNPDRTCMQIESFDFCSGEAEDLQLRII